MPLATLPLCAKQRHLGRLIPLCQCIMRCAALPQLECDGTPLHDVQHHNRYLVSTPGSKLFAPSFPHCRHHLSQLIARMGRAINNPESVYYWAWKNDIQVYCPSITDGTIGSMLHSHRYAALH
jgi:hypothetical protein